MSMTKNGTDELILSITKSCVTPIEQAQTKPLERLAFKLTQKWQTFSFSSPIIFSTGGSKYGNCLIGLTSIEIHNSSFTMTERKTKKFE